MSVHHYDYCCYSRVAENLSLLMKLLVDLFWFHNNGNRALDDNKQKRCCCEQSGPFLRDDDETKFYGYLLISVIELHALAILTGVDYASVLLGLRHSRSPGFPFFFKYDLSVPTSWYTFALSPFPNEGLLVQTLSSACINLTKRSICLLPEAHTDCVYTQTRSGAHPS